MIFAMELDSKGLVPFYQCQKESLPMREHPTVIANSDRHSITLLLQEDVVLNLNYMYIPTSN